MNTLRRQSAWAFLPALLWCFMAVDTVSADGKFFPRVEVADEPGITAQRAAIIFKDGVQTLIVQSDVEGEDAAYGWILPLPAEPTSIEACAPYTLHGLGQVVRPRMALPATSVLWVVVPLMLVVVIFGLDHVIRSSRQVERVSPIPMLVAILVTLLLVSVLLPSMGTAGAVAGFGGKVEVLQTAKAGVYDVVVLKAETAEAVEEWLETNGFSCPPSATSVIADYVAGDWCFLAAKVSREMEGTFTHHPLSITFPASEAVYPMRLTGVDGEPVQLDLYVVGEQRASASGMRPWSCDVYEKDDKQAWDDPFKTYACKRPPVYRGSTYYASIGIPAISERMWPGCVLTRLHGRLEAPDMRDDLALTWVDPAPMRATVYGAREAVGWSAAYAVLAFTGLFAWFIRTAVVRRWNWTTMLRRRLGAAVVPAVLVGVVCYVSFDVVPTQERKRGDRRMISVYTHMYLLQELSKAPPTSSFPEAYREPLTDYELLTETDRLEKPGDFHIEPDGEGWRLTILDQYYVPVTVLIGETGVPRKAGERADEEETADAERTNVID